jgi:nucleoside-triphosphatase
MHQSRRIVLLTGRPGVGKTTAAGDIAARLGPKQTDGFISSEIREDGRRAGFGVAVLHSNEVGLLARPGLVSEFRFGSPGADGHPRLGVTHEFLENVACRRIEASEAPLIVIDEIGPMQATSARFRRLVESLLAEARSVFGTVALAEDDWISAVRDHPDVSTIELTHGNRDTVREALIAYFASTIGQL